MRHFKSFAVAVLGATALASAVHAQGGQFSGNPIVILNDDGRTLTLTQPFSYKDFAGVTWKVPAGKRVDGASIPQPFWTFIGGPLEGKYRNASIIHDYYCDEKTRPWRDVHRIFYEGMLTGGVEKTQAKLMYYAVYKFGPRWDIRKIKVPMSSFSGPPVLVEREIAIPLPSPEYDADQVQAAIDLIATSDPSLVDLEQLADATPTPLPR